MSNRKKHRTPAKTLAAAMRDGDELPAIPPQVAKFIAPETSDCVLCTAPTHTVGCFRLPSRRWFFYGLCVTCSRDPHAPDRVDVIALAHDDDTLATDRQ